MAGWWWWRRRRSAGGAGGVGVNEASAMAAAATTTAVMEAAEKEVADRLALKQLTERVPRGGEQMASNRSSAGTGRRSHPLGTS